MSKPLIDGKKLNKMPSFSMPKSNNIEQLTRANTDDKSPAVSKDTPSTVKKEVKEDKPPVVTEKVVSPTLSSSSNTESAVRDDLAGLDADPIFRELCAKDAWKNESSCLVCGKAFGTLKFISKRNCEFCGSCVCDEHSKKKRPSPKNPSEFARICEICDEKHIRRDILHEFDERMKRREKELADLEAKIKDQQIKTNEVQTDYDNIMIQKARNEKNYLDQVTFLSNEISRMKDETKKCEKENTLLTKEFTDTQKKTEELDVRMQEAQVEYESLKIEAATLTTQLDAVNQDITQINREMRDIEKLIVNGKVTSTPSDLRARGMVEKGFSKSVVDGKQISFDSSYVSDRTERLKTHYEGIQNRVSRKHTKRDDGAASMSNACEVKCNIF